MSDSDDYQNDFLVTPTYSSLATTPRYYSKHQHSATLVSFTSSFTFSLSLHCTDPCHTFPKVTKCHIFKVRTHRKEQYLLTYIAALIVNFCHASQRITKESKVCPGLGNWSSVLNLEALIYFRGTHGQTYLTRRRPKPRRVPMKPTLRVSGYSNFVNLMTSFRSQCKLVSKPLARADRPMIAARTWGCSDIFAY